MSDQFADLHQIHHTGDMSDHTINGVNASSGVEGVHSQEYTTSDGTHEWVVSNPEGGKDVYHGSILHERTIPTGHGTHDVYDSQMHLKATITPNVHGGHDISHDGNVTESSLPLGHGAFTVLNYGDPLLHLSEYVMTKLFL